MNRGNKIRNVSLSESINYREEYEKKVVELNSANSRINELTTELNLYKKDMISFYLVNGTAYEQLPLGKVFTLNNIELRVVGIETDLPKTVTLMTTTAYVDSLLTPFALEISPLLDGDDGVAKIYPNSNVHRYITAITETLFPEYIVNSVKTVTKTYCTVNGNSATMNARFWVPSAYELGYTEDHLNVDNVLPGFANLPEPYKALVDNNNNPCTYYTRLFTNMGASWTELNVIGVNTYGNAFIQQIDGNIASMKWPFCFVI